MNVLLVLLVLVACIAGYVMLLRKHRQWLDRCDAALTTDEGRERELATSRADDMFLERASVLCAALLCGGLPVWWLLQPSGLANALEDTGLRVLTGFVVFYALVGIFVSQSARLIIGAAAVMAVAATLARIGWKIALWAWR